MRFFNFDKHQYAWVSAPDISWTAAKEEALLVPNGCGPGSLVIINSPDENNFVAGLSNIIEPPNGRFGWIAGRRKGPPNQNEWMWDPGLPLNGNQGRVFFVKTSLTSGTSLLYSNWDGGGNSNIPFFCSKPPDGPGCDLSYAHIYPSPAGTWNNFPDAGNPRPNRPPSERIGGYIIEYDYRAPKPKATPASQTICSEDMITKIEITDEAHTDQETLPGTTFTWTRDNMVNVKGIDDGTQTIDGGNGTIMPGTLIMKITGALKNVTNVVQIVTYIIVAKSPDDPLCKSQITVTVKVKPKPTVAAVQFFPISTISCDGLPTFCEGDQLYELFISNPNNVADVQFVKERTNDTRISEFDHSGARSLFTENSQPGVVPPFQRLYGTFWMGGFIAYHCSEITQWKNIKAVADGCESERIEVVPFRVLPRPTIREVLYTFCNEDNNASLTFTSNVDCAVRFTWTSTIDFGYGLSGSVTANSTNNAFTTFTFFNIHPVNTGNAAIAGKITVTTSLLIPPECKPCPGEPKEITLIIKPTPDVVQQSDLTYSNGQSAPSIGFTSHTTGGAIIFLWTSSIDIGFGTSGAGLSIPAFTATNNAAGPIVTHITVFPVVDACIGPAMEFNITVNPSCGAIVGVPKTWFVDDGSNSGDRWTVGSVPGSDLTGDGTSLKPFRTITKAISLASNGDNINVDAGSYSESINITKSLKIYGPNYDQSPIMTPSTRVTEAVITAPTSTGVVFDAHTICTNIEIKGFKLVSGAPLTDGHVHRSPDQNIDIVFEKNLINHANNLFAGALTRWRSITITDNHFTNTDFTATSSAIQLNDANDPLPAPQRPATVTAVITDNKIETTNFGAILLDNIASATVQRNIIKAVPREAIQLAGGMGSATISENDIRNSNLSNIPDGGGIRIFGSQFTGTINIRNNFVTNNTFNGVAVKNGEAITNPNIHINNNSFTGLAPGSYGIYHGGTNPGGTGGATSPAPGKLDGECNWFGSPNAAIVPTKVFGPVDFAPWLNNGTDGSTNPGFQPSGICSGGAPIASKVETPGEDIIGPSVTKSKEVTSEVFSVSVSPNPTSKDFTLKIETAGKEPVTIKISDAVGRIISVYSNVSGKTIKFGSNFKTGLYYAEIIQGSKHTVTKLIKVE